MLFATVLSVVSVFMAGKLTNRFTSTQLMKKALIGLVIGAAICYFMLYKNHNLMLAMIVFTLFQGFPLVLLGSLFPVQIRLTGDAFF